MQYIFTSLIVIAGTIAFSYVVQKIINKLEKKVLAQQDKAKITANNSLI